MANRTFPNNYFVWYNDDRRVAILELDTTSTSGENTTEQYDSFQSEDDVASGLRITFNSKYEEVTTSNLTAELSTSIGVDTGIQDLITCYIKSRMYEDMQDLEKARYFREMYERELKKYPTRKSGIRALSVPYL
jgi:hypothetical protein